MSDPARFAPLRQRIKGFSLMELLVVVCIIAVLGVALLNRVWFYQEQAEKAAMEQVAGVLQSALTLEFGKLMVRGDRAGADALATENPMNWLVRPPANYAGEFYNPGLQAVAPGNWMFDLKSRDLIYVVDHGEYFTPGRDGIKWVRYHVNLVYDSKPGEGGKMSRTVVGAAIEPIDTYRWFDRKL